MSKPAIVRASIVISGDQRHGFLQLEFEDGTAESWPIPGAALATLRVQLESLDETDPGWKDWLAWRSS